jgi:hypothetical protein
VDWLDGRWTLRHAHRKMLTVGLGRAAAYAGVPVSGSAALERWDWHSLVLLWPVFGLLYAWLSAGWHPRWVRWLAGGVAAACLVDNLPLRLPLWDAYAGDLGAAPYQTYIDYGLKQGGLVLWAPPDTIPAPWPIRVLGREVALAGDATAGGQDLLETSGYTGFAALHPGAATAVEPGREWDRALANYASGRRLRPVWGTGQVGYRGQGGGASMDPVQTVFLTGERSRQGVLEAMAAGRMYAVRGAGARLVLSTFEASRGGVAAISGGTLLGGSGAVRLTGTIALADGARDSVRVRLVQDGRVVADFVAAAPVDFGHVDAGPAPGHRTYYRLLAATGGCQLASNPVFVEGGAF